MCFYREIDGRKGLGAASSLVAVMYILRVYREIDGRKGLGASEYWGLLKTWGKPQD